jgi:uncharacterized repeat protein (TIGR01451 family)
MRSRVPRHAAKGGSRRRRVRLGARVLESGLAALAVVGFVAYAAPAAYGHTNPVLSGSSCQNGPGSGWSIKWTVQNDENLSESVTVTAVTGGLSTLNTTTFSIAPTPSGQPESSTTIGQTLPNTASGSVTLSFTGTWSDGVTNSSSGTYVLSSNASCGIPLQKQTIGGQIYLCSSGNPTTTSVPGGKLAATGPQDIAAVSDPMAATDVPAGAYSMAATAPPGYTLVACRGSAALATNGLTATEAVAVPAGGNGEGVFYVAPATVVPPSSPSISLQQRATRSSFSGVGQVITYNYLVSNTGSGGLTKVTVAHPRTGSSVSCSESSLASGSEETCTASYLTTSSDIAAGEIVNTATATATTSTGSNVTSSPSTLTIRNQGTESLSLVKSSIFANYNAVGERIPYTFDVTNTGADPVDGIVINDQLPNIVLDPCPDATLDPGLSETCHGHYFVTEADLNAGHIVNTATAEGNVDGVTVTSPPSTWSLVSVQEIAGHIFQCFTTGPSDLEVDGGMLHAVGPTPSTNVVYSGSNPIHPHRPVAMGDYTMTATLPPPAVPGQPGWAFVSCPGEPIPYTISADGRTATETVPVPNGGVGTGAFFVVAARPAIKMTKSVQQPYYSGAGQTLNFNFLVTNTGNVGLGNVGITDTLAGVTGLSCPETGLAAGATETCTGKYTTTAADVTAQSIVNHATAHGTPPNDPNVPVVSSASSAATVSLLAVSVTKTASPTSIVAGSTTPITYTLTVTNTGKVTTPTPMNIADSAPGGTTIVTGSAACTGGGAAACTVASAGPTVTWTIAAGVKPTDKAYTLTFRVTANANDPKGNIVNTALWNGAACAAGSCTTNTVTTPVSASGSSSSSSSSSSKLAFTGAMLAQEWMVGLGVIVLGGALLLVTHRRRSPKHAATRWGLREVLLSPHSHRNPSGDRKD